MNVIILPTAEQELEEAYCWLRERSPEHADRWLAGLIKAKDSLAQFPERCPLAPENSHFPEEIRQLLYGKRGSQYRFLFTIRDGTVFILHIRHAAREYLTREDPGVCLT